MLCGARRTENIKRIVFTIINKGGVEWAAPRGRHWMRYLMQVPRGAAPLVYVIDHG